MNRERRDFFVAYTSVDEAWATWIAHVLEDAGHSVVIQAWDFRPGSNFVVEMQQALQSSDRLIAVLTPAYLQARYPQAEWSAVFAADPEGTKKKLVPVMVQRCEPDGLLSQVVQIRIHDLDEPAARQKLLTGVKAGRAKPRLPDVPRPAGGDAKSRRHYGAIGSGAGLATAHQLSRCRVAQRAGLPHPEPEQRVCGG